MSDSRPKNSTPPVRVPVLLISVVSVAVISVVCLGAAVLYSPFVSPTSAKAVGAGKVVTFNVKSVELKPGYHGRRTSDCTRWRISGESEARTLTATHCTSQLAKPSPGETYQARVAPFGSAATFIEVYDPGPKRAAALLGLSFILLVLGFVLSVFTFGLTCAAVTSRLGRRPIAPGLATACYRILHKF